MSRSQTRCPKALLHNGESNGRGPIGTSPAPGPAPGDSSPGAFVAGCPSPHCTERRRLALSVLSDVDRSVRQGVPDPAVSRKHRALVVPADVALRRPDPLPLAGAKLGVRATRAGIVAAPAGTQLALDRARIHQHLLAPGVCFCGATLLSTSRPTHLRSEKRAGAVLVGPKPVAIGFESTLHVR